MSTAEELRREIAEVLRRLEDSKRKSEALDQDIVAANDRQSLRRELDRFKYFLQVQERINKGKEIDRDDIDADRDGDHLPPDHMPQQFPHMPSGQRNLGYDNPKEGEVNVALAVTRGEYTWRLHGVSWLENALADNFEDIFISSDFRVGSSVFDLVYAPAQTCIDAEETQIGSLALRHREESGIIFRYTMYIKKAGGEFVQWGDEGNECHPDWENRNKAFGPDVQPVPAKGCEPQRPIGIFGLSHRALLKSEWVEDDTLTVKVKVGVIKDSSTWTRSVEPNVDVPPPTMATNLLSMFQDGKCSDVTFLVDGRQIKAHSQILSARSEFFDRELNGGMQESVSKQVEIEDVDYATFEVFLQFLYTDDFDHVETLIKSRVAEEASRISAEGGGSSSSSSSQLTPTVNPRTAILQSILAVSHRYQVQRLRLWCEQQLCEYICKDQVSSLLCQAHLYDAKQLEKVCLTFIKENLDTVFPTAGFGSLSAEWPQVMLKISLFLADVSDNTAAPAMAAYQASRKRRAEQVDEESTTSTAKNSRKD